MQQFDSTDAPFLTPKLRKVLGEPDRNTPRNHGGIWHNAKNVTRVFNKPSRIPVAVERSPLPPVAVATAAAERRKVVRKSTSVPSLKSSNAGPGAGTFSHTPFEDLYPPLPSFRAMPPNSSPKVSKSKAKASPSTRSRRVPHISSPSLPKALDCVDFSHPKLSYPLSPMPSPLAASFPQGIATPSPGNATAAAPTTSDDGADFLDGTEGGIRLVRRRTKSTPGVKFGKRNPFSPGLTTPAESDRSQDEDPTIVIDIKTPSIRSPGSGHMPSPSLSISRSSTSYFPESSPVIDIASPKSFTSVKRKPVPRYLYTDPPEHDASAPSTPTLTPSISSPPSQIPSALPRLTTPSLFQTPLLPSSELIVKSCNPPRPSERGLSPLPIGQDFSGSVRRRHHRRSVSANAIDQLLSPVKTIGLPSPWYTTNANGSVTALVTPAEEQPVFSFAHDLPAPPRISLHSPPQTPPRTSSGVSTFSQETSAPVAASKNALSPLTDDEIDALRSFLDHHESGSRAQQRRKVGIAPESRSRSASNVSAAYDMHTQIFDSYALEEQDSFLVGGVQTIPERDMANPIPEGEAWSLLRLNAEHPESYTEVETPIMQQDEDEVETPVDVVNRGTFGYYHPHIRQQLFDDDAPETEGKTLSARPSLDESLKEDGASATPLHSANLDEFGTPECSDERTAVPGSSLSLERSSSIYHMALSGENANEEEEEGLAYLRTSHQALISRFSFDSDSESDRPMTSSSTSASISTTHSSRPFIGGFQGGIGLAILPQEQFAYFEKYDRAQSHPPCTPSDRGNEDYDYDSPDTISHASPNTMRHRRFEMRNLAALDRVRDELDNQPPSPGSPIQFATQYAPTLLRPALRINPRLAAACTSKPMPSPTDTISTYPPRTVNSIPIRGHQGHAQHSKTKSQAINASTSSDEALRDNLKSFMNLTPNGKAKESAGEGGKKGKVRLRQLFSRTNLRGQAKRDAEVKS